MFENNPQKNNRNEREHRTINTSSKISHANIEKFLSVLQQQEDITLYKYV